MRFTTITAAIVAMTLASGLTAAETPLRPEDICPILVGEKVPDLVLRDMKGKTFDLSAAFAAKPTILIFYRGGWCPYCNLHLGQLQEAESTLVGLGYQILAVSPDRPEKLGAPIEKNELSYTLLSDSTMKAATSLGLAFRVDDDTIEKYKGFGIDLEADSGEKHHLLPVPAALVVGRDGVVKFSYVNPNYKMRIDPDVLVAAAKAALR
jgi:peroxiredoxin